MHGAAGWHALSPPAALYCEFGVLCDAAVQMPTIAVRSS